MFRGENFMSCMLSTEEKIEVASAASRLREALSLFVSAPPETGPLGEELLGFARELEEASAGAVQVREAGAPVIRGKASLTVSSRTFRNVHYLALPTGRELSPFLDALLWLGKAAEPPGLEAAGGLEEVAYPARCMVFVTATCPRCPLVVRAAISLAVRIPSFSVTVVDAQRHEDLAARFRVRATPTLIVDEAATFVGEVKAEEIARHLRGLSRGDSLTEVLRSMIGAGRAEDAARLLVREKRPGDLLSLYLANDLSTRIGALLVMEEALALDRRALDPIMESLLGFLSHRDAAVRGDTAALLGKTGDPRAASPLRKALEDLDPDVREAAREALEELAKGV